MNVMNYFQTNFEYFCGGLTQQQVAVLLGVTQTTVPRYVKNPKLIRMTAFLSLCRWANVSMDEFLFVDLRERAVPSFSMADVEGLKNNVDLFFEGNMVVMDKVSALNESDGAAIYGTVGSVEKLKVFFEVEDYLIRDYLIRDYLIRDYLIKDGLIFSASVFTFTIFPTNF